MGAAPGSDDLAPTDYVQTMAVWSQLVDVRFRLLALVPALTAAGVGLLGNVSDVGTLRVTLVALLGLATVIALMVYDLRNSTLHDLAIHRLKTLEIRDLRFERSVRRMGLLPSQGVTHRGVNTERPWPQVLAKDESVGGVFAERPPRTTRLLGVRVQHDVALAVAYTASAAAWAALAAYSALRRFTNLDPTELLWSSAAVVALIVALLVFGLRLHEASARYTRHVLTSGIPTELWNDWTEPSSFWNDRVAKRIREAERATGVIRSNVTRGGWQEGGLMNGTPSWQSVVVAVAIIALVGVFFVVGLSETDDADDFLKIWGGVGIIVGLVAGAIPSFFFKAQADKASATAEQAVRTAKQHAERAQVLASVADPTAVDKAMKMAPAAFESWQRPPGP